MFILRLLCDLPEPRISARWAPDSRRRIPEVEARIDAAWSAAAARPGVHLFDGKLCHLDSFSATADSLELRLSPTSYKIFMGTNLTHPEWAARYGVEVLANPLGVSAALETADGFLMLGRRNAAVAYYPNRVHPFAGSLEAEESADIFAAVRRELSEELSLSAADISQMHCLGLVEDAVIRQPELIFLVRCNLDRAAIEARIDPLEHAGAMALGADEEAARLAAAAPALTPVAAATTLLWARRHFGDSWFQRQCEALKVLHSPD
jgi:8-oxo-dGTP pyrophosphatase MutT (NUDIX family)